jgi:hypothetical protein
MSFILIFTFPNFNNEFHSDEGYYRISETSRYYFNIHTRVNRKTSYLKRDNEIQSSRHQSSIKIEALIKIVESFY